MSLAGRVREAVIDNDYIWQETISANQPFPAMGGMQ
jgi:hypothetical protein